MSTIVDPLAAADQAEPAAVEAARASVTPAPALAAPPDISGFAKRASDGSRSAFKAFNRSFMVPIHRAGLGVWLANPISGWLLLVTTTGRKSGLRRDTPLGYYVAEGSVWVLAGYGPSTLWYRNLVADPKVEVLAPGRPPFTATAHDVTDPAIRARIIPPLVRSMAAPGSMIGTIPNTAPDERILELVAWVPLVELRPDGPPLVAGPDDPGGWGWIPRQLFATFLSLLLIRAVAGFFGRRKPA
jgi:deazaflavin-dependent oxidoreductase (nitroreductase family)